MKKLMIASAIAMTMAAGSAMAAQTGDVKFFGSVSAVTCDLAPEISGNVVSTVQLGSVSTSTDGQPVRFSLKAANPTAGGCATLTGKTAEFSWNGPMHAEGFANQGGAATDAYVKLKTLNGKTTQQQEIKASNTVVSFDADKAANDGFQFEATLHGGSVEGDFQTAAAYAVTYK
ncbi:fimbrial protein [Salmonella enterica]|uniref:fimbrial protein n=1 Tax=Salmonella enterica TaxID=28901 RepID=UPI0026DD835A|nr:fimbrial protein [Salmonella enterica]MDO3872081.1 fimbrial protein [Salmonella enterica]MDO3886845.1 fimbrial protein [Salmonella enterica]MDO3900038.1 fimbrial protein [Salmonella enterica]MDO3976206.1 fimbrial protein [Salmonella enterica]